MTDILQDLSTASIISAIEANFYAQERFFASLPDVELHEEPDVTWFSSSRPFAMLNQVLNIRFTADEADAKIDTLLTHFQSHPHTQWWIGPGTQPSDLRSRLIQRGLTTIVRAPGMALDLHTLNEDMPVRPDLRIERVGDLKTLGKWASVHLLNFHASQSEIKTLFEAYARSNFTEQFPLQHYIGWLNRKPVATATLFLSNGVAGLYNVGTHPVLRGRGIGRTISLATLRAARSMGYRMSILQSTERGLYLYRQLGFQEYCTISAYTKLG